jgi:hypothetical protein
MTTTYPSPGDHLTPEGLAAYLDGAVGSDERLRIQEHLEGCDSCRQEAAEVVLLLQRRGNRRVKRLAVPVAAAAAVAAILLLTPSLQNGGRGPGERVRVPEPASGVEALPTVRALSPAPGSTVGQADLVFAWEEAGEDAVYRLTVTDESGEPLWFHETTQTTVPLPLDVELLSEQTFFWFVDVLLPDGSTASTGVMSFSVGS